MAAHCIQHPDLKYRRSFAQSRLSIGRSRRLLSPAYDLNPVPTDIKPRVLTTAIDLEGQDSLAEIALEVAAYFELGAGAARQIAAEVGQGGCQVAKGGRESRPHSRGNRPHGVGLRA